MENTGAIRVCSAQMAGVWGDSVKTLEKSVPFIRHAAASGASLICFPEQFATGWSPRPGPGSETIEGPVVSSLKRSAQEYGIAILGSFRETGNSLPRNTAVVIGEDGGIRTWYSKIHLFSPGGEHEGFSPGSDLGLFRLGQLSCGIAICYDLRFPELFRLYAKKGVHAMFVPAAWPAVRMKHWELFITARACENQMYVVGINTTGTTPIEHYTGGSMTADPYGSVISRANDAEQLLFSDLDPETVRSARTAFPVGRDCRDDLYAKLAGRKP